jgi:RNA polymerase sigma-70 factor (ECF subfamily)
MNEADFHDLYRRHARDVYRFALYLSGRRDRAEEVAAETFARAWTSFDPVRTQTMKAYLFSIARNLISEAHRREARVRPLAEEAPDEAASPAMRAAARAELEAVLRALQRLPDSDRAALLMRAQDGLSHADIAAALGISVAAARVKIHRARLALRGFQLREERKR